MESTLLSRIKYPELAVYKIDEEMNKRFAISFGRVDRERDYLFWSLKVEDRWLVKARESLYRKWTRRADKNPTKYQDFSISPLGYLELLELTDEGGEGFGGFFGHDNEFWCDRFILREVWPDKLEQTLGKLKELGIVVPEQNIHKDFYDNLDIYCIFDTPMPWKMHQNLKKAINHHWVSPFVSKGKLDGAMFSKEVLCRCATIPLTREVFQSTNSDFANCYSGRRYVNIIEEDPA